MTTPTITNSPAAATTTATLARAECSNTTVTAKKAAKKTFSRKCLECGQPFQAVKAEGRFCCTKHQQAFHNLSMTRGKIAMPLLMGWRSARNRTVDKATGSWAFTELCALADEWNRQDREAGRTPAFEYITAKKRSGWKAADAFV